MCLSMLVEVKGQLSGLVLSGRKLMQYFPAEPSVSMVDGPVPCKIIFFSFFSLFLRQHLSFSPECHETCYVDQVGL